MQLCACLATHDGHNSLVNAGTGSGQTLSITLDLLLDNPTNEFISSFPGSPLEWKAGLAARAGKVLDVHCRWYVA